MNIRVLQRHCGLDMFLHIRRSYPNAMLINQIMRRARVSLSVGRGEKLSVKKGGGLTAKGRARYNRATGSHLKAPVTKKGRLSPSDRSRRKSFCARSKSWHGPRGLAARRRWRC